MGLVARLQDVEQQLSRVTGVVQLHVKLTASSVAVDVGNVKTREEVLALVGTVERVQGKLQKVTEQLLTLIKQSLEGASIGEKGGDTNPSTEDVEMDQEEPPITVKIEKCEENVAVEDKNSGQNQGALMESYVDEVVAKENVVQLKDEIQEVVADPCDAFSRYVAGANTVVKASRMNDSERNAKEMISRLSDKEAQVWSDVVDAYALDATRELLQRFQYGNFDNEMAASFLEATELAVSLIVSRRVQLQKRKWLMRFDKGLFGIVEAVKGTQLEQALLPVEASHFDLMFFCSSSALEDMLNDVALVDFKDGIDASTLLPHLKALMRKFMFDCDDYMLRNETVGDSPRTEAEWSQFADIGLALGKWLDSSKTTGAFRTKLDCKTFLGKLREFDLQFGGRIPLTLFESLSRMSFTGSDFQEPPKHSSSSVSCENQTIVNLSDVDESVELPKFTLEFPVKSIRRSNKKRKRLPSSEWNQREGKEIVADANATSSAVRTLPNSNDFDLDSPSPNPNGVKRKYGDSVEDIPQTVGESIDTKALQVYISAAKEAKEAIESMMQQRNDVSASATTEMLVVEKWNQVVKLNFTRANKIVFSLLKQEMLDLKIAADFAEATVLAVSLITIAEKEANYRQRWIFKTIILLEDIRPLIEKSHFALALLPVLESQDALIRFFEEYRSDYLIDTSSFVLKIEETESEEIELTRLQNIMNVLANKVVRDSTYCIIRHRVSDLLPWTTEQWQKFILSVCFLSDWTELFMSASGSQPKWLQETGAALQKVDRKFPGRLPRPLLGFSASFTHSEVSCEEPAHNSHDSQLDDSSTSTVNIDAEDGLSQTNSLNTEATNTNVEPVRPTSKIKRVKQRGDVDITAPDTAAQITAFLEKATHVSQSFEVGQEIESFSKEATEIQRLCSQATLVNKLFAKVVACREIDHDGAVKFAQATKTLTELICRCPSDCMGHARLKALLKQYDQICRITTGRTYSVHLAVALVSDYKKLEKYWQDHFADPFKAMRNHVQLTERGIVNLEPKSLEYPLRQLICKFGDTCDVSLYEFKKNISNDRATQLREGSKEIGRLLNVWIQRILDANIRAQLNGKKFRKKLVRYETKAPGSIPISLMENVKRLSENTKT